MRFLSAVSRWTLAPFGAVMRLLLNTPSTLPPPIQNVCGLSEQKLSIKPDPQRQRVIDVLEAAPPLPLSELAREVCRHR